VRRHPVAVGIRERPHTGQIGLGDDQGPEGIEGVFQPGSASSKRSPALANTSRGPGDSRTGVHRGVARSALKATRSPEISPLSRSAVHIACRQGVRSRGSGPAMTDIIRAHRPRFGSAGNVLQAPQPDSPGYARPGSLVERNSPIEPCTVQAQCAGGMRTSPRRRYQRHWAHALATAAADRR